jgi:RNA polymerase sigma-70 factor (ECF subfamily)
MHTKATGPGEILKWLVKSPEGPGQLAPLEGGVTVQPFTQMDVSADLLRAFSTHLPGGEDRIVAGCGETLGRVVEHAQASWPGLEVPVPTFVRYLAERIPPEGDVREALAGIHAADLYLACACARQVPGAIERFENHFAKTVDAFIRGVHGMAAGADEIRQLLRQKLFVDEGAAGGERAKIERYSGKGKLSSWVGVTVQRTALNLARSDSARREIDLDTLSDAIPSGANPELDYLKARYRAEFRAAFQRAVAELTQRERVILRHHYVNGLSQERIAQLYQNNQATVSRWIASARESIRRSAERELRAKLNASASDIQSIAALIRSQFDISLARCLGTGTGG